MLAYPFFPITTRQRLLELARTAAFVPSESFQARLDNHNQITIKIIGQVQPKTQGFDKMCFMQAWVIQDIQQNNNWLVMRVAIILGQLLDVPAVEYAD
eukprot:m.236608 g.236608  ORF g.236608 m.236608 type:complete len:98 (+) comp16051_c0_seq15:662-955(+)